MSKKSIAVTIDEELLDRLDRVVGEQGFPDRSSVVQEAIREKVERLTGQLVKMQILRSAIQPAKGDQPTEQKRERLVRECAKLDPEFEQQLAEEGIAEDFRQWPEY